MVASVVRYVVAAALVVGLVVAAGFAVGVVGPPDVDGVENRFAAVGENETVVATDVVVNNPNPMGVSIGGLGVDYTIYMNDHAMATGAVDGVEVGSGRSTVEAESVLDNDRIPDWWHSHLTAGERTEVSVDAGVSHSLLGDRAVSIRQDETVETDVLSEFNSTEPRPIDADTVVSDPVLVLNETAAWWGDDLTPERTPIEKEFTLYNPKPWPYTITEIGYTVEMNGIAVGEGATDRAHVLAPASTETIRASTVVENDRLDDWWASHLRRNEVTTLAIDFYVVVDPDPGDLFDGAVDPIRIDSDPIDYETEIETDVFGTKGDEAPRWLGENGTEANATGGTEGDGETGTPSPTPSEETESTGGRASPATPTPTPEADEEDGDGLLGGSLSTLGATAWD